MKLFRRYNPQPPYAYCRSCPWLDPDDDRVGSIQDLAVSVELAARAHADEEIHHDVRLMRVQEIILRHGVPEAVAR